MTSEGLRSDMAAMLPVAMQQLDVPNEQLNDEQLRKQQECLQTLCFTTSGATYDWYKGRVERRVEGTCKWFLQHETFQKWLLQESGLLLVSADPGCGKSVLAKYLIDHELAQQSAICYFFFKDQDQNTICQALCALLHQLFSKKAALIQHAMDLYNKLSAALVQSERSLWTILRDSVRDPRAGPVIFVIDALDECDELQLYSLIRNLKNISCGQQLARTRFKVIMTSRPYEHILDSFYKSLQDDFLRIHIAGDVEFEAISQEINSVIRHRVKLLARKHRLSDEIKSSLNSKLLAIDHRTYLWAHLVFDHLDKGFERTDEGIDTAIQALPQSVNQAYGQILNRSLKDGTAKTVDKVLSIILAAHRPLTLSEMNIAMNLNGEGRVRSIYDLDLEQDKNFKTRLRALCGLFVNVHHDKVYFLHQTAREFLIESSAPTTVSSGPRWQHSITTRHAHSVLAEICMFYLDRLNSTDTETFFEDDRESALFQYSVEYWGGHCREAEYEKGSAMVDLASRLCTPDLTSQFKWASIISSRYHIRPGSSASVLVSSRLGLTAATELLLSRGVDIEARDGRGWTALMIAAESGYEAVIRLLLDNGADVEAKNDGRTALLYAAESGHEAVTRLLLAHRADVEARDDDGTTALMYAATYGHNSVTRLLLINGADVEVKDSRGRTALMIAIESGHEAVSRLVLLNGADVEVKDSRGRTALIIAAGYGYAAVTRLLLVDGAYVAAKDDDGKTALMLSAEFGYEAVIRLLLKNDADVEAKGNDGKTALIHAARSGHEAATRLLLENGADVKARGGDGMTALLYAAGSGHEAVTRLLLENDADVETKNNGKTALLFAAESGHEGVTRLLLENGADVEAKNNGKTALLYAAESGHESVIHALLENRADVEAMDDDGRTALLYAARFGRDAVTRLLLENGADVKARDDDGMTALIYAARYGHEAATQLLLEKGADITARDEDGMTALLYAVESGHETVTRLLLRNGADVQAKDDEGWTALIYAAKSGHEAIIQLLLENSADIEAKDNKGWNALSHASKTTTRLLLYKGAQVDAQDVEG